MDMAEFLKWAETAPVDLRADAAHALARAFLNCEVDEETLSAWRALLNAHARVTGRRPKVTSGLPSGAFITDAADMVRRGIPTAIYGPADAPQALIRGRRRKRFLVRADRDVDLQGFLAAWRARAKPPSAVRLTIDVDPYSFL